MDYVGVHFLMIIPYNSQAKPPHVTKMPTFRKLSDLGFYDKASDKKVAMKKVIKICCLGGSKKYKNSIFKLLEMRPFGLSLLIIKGLQGNHQ